MDQIEFVQERVADPVDDIVRVRINGRSLEDLCEGIDESDLHAPLAVRDVFQEGRSLWADLPPNDAELVLADGRVAILTCNCGVFGCGGVVARITFDDDVVSWSEFGHVHPHQDEATRVASLASFRFDRAQYLSALDNVGA